LPRVGCRLRRSDARAFAYGLRDRGRFAATSVIVLTIMSAALNAPPADAADAPTNISPPTITGTPQAGQRLTEGHGSWTNQPTRYTYHWGRCNSAGKVCDAIAGATDQTYGLTPADVGHAIVVNETAHNAAGASDPATSAATPAISPPPPPPPGPPPTTVTTLTASPSAPVVNQTVTLIAAVTSSDAAIAPSGVVRFLTGGSAISGCANVPVNPVGQSVVVTCQTWFAASIPQLVATFSPGPSATTTGSTSPVLSLPVGPETTSISLDASATVGVGAGATYTATVDSPPGGLGTLHPTGTVEFFDGGEAIASCLSRPLANTGATCAVTYSVPGNHSITARYSGDANFRDSSAPAQPVSVVNPPPRALGLISSTMQWTFDSTPTFTKVLALTVNGASGATVTTRCNGRGCAFVRRSTLVATTRRCAQAPTRRCPTYGTLDLTPGFQSRRLSVGARITVTITRAGWVGKYYQFTVRARSRPRVKIACLAPGAVRPGVGC
jgi:hypothetical protein